MAEEKSDELASGPNWNRNLVYAALLASVANGSVGVFQTDDRYRGADAERDFAPVKADIATLKSSVRECGQENDELRRQLNAHLHHSARYTQKIDHQERDITNVADRLERHEARNH